MELLRYEMSGEGKKKKKANCFSPVRYFSGFGSKIMPWTLGSSTLK
jgi:hypothetical protein